MSVTSLASCKQKKGNDEVEAQHKAYFTNNEKHYYNNGSAVYHIQDDGTTMPVKIYDEAIMSGNSVDKLEKDLEPVERLSNFRLIPEATLRIGNDAYGFTYDETTLYHWYYSEDTMVNQEKLFDEDDFRPVAESMLQEAGVFDDLVENAIRKRVDELLREEFLAAAENDFKREPSSSDHDSYIERRLEEDFPDYLKENTEKAIQKQRSESLSRYQERIRHLAAENLMASMKNPVYDGNEYIYTVTTVNPEALDEYWYLDAKTIRYSKDGSKLEWISNAPKALALTIHDEWLYYYNSGFEPTKDHPSQINTAVTGIYKKKLNGSEEQKITDIHIETDEKTSDSEKRNLFRSGVSGMVVVGDYLYYLKASDTLYGGELYRITIKDGQPERVSSNTCTSYYVDVDNETLYYLNYSPEAGNKLYRRNLSDNTETLLPDLSPAKLRNQVAITLSNHYLYFCQSDYTNQLIDRENGVKVQDKNNKEININDIEYLLYRSTPSGARFNVESGKLELMYSYYVVKLEEDPFQGFTATRIEPLVTFWKSLDEIEDECKKLEEKYNLNHISLSRNTEADQTKSSAV